MLTVSPIVNSPSALTLPPSVLATSLSDSAVSTRTTSVALTAPLSNLQVTDNAHSSVQVPAASEEDAQASAAVFGASGTLTGNLNTSGPSAAFLAQLIGQGAGATFSPAPVYNTFVGYGFIKYRPSDAGIPAPRAAQPSPVAISAPLEQSLPSIPAPAPAPAAQTVQVSTSALPETLPQNDNASAALPANDYQAYSNTVSRNQQNLSFAEPQLIVAG